MLTAHDNPRLKHVRALIRQAKARQEYHQMVLEGVRLIEDSLLYGAKLDYVLYNPEASPATLSLVRHIEQTNQIPCFAVEPKRFNDLSDTQNPQGILAVCDIPDLPMPESLSLMLILDSIHDPGNVGTILRTAAAVGVDLVAIAPNTVDITNPKVVRSAMSAHFHVPIQTYYSWETIAAFQMPLWITDGNAQQTIYQVDWHSPLSLVIGSEANGVSDSARQLAHGAVKIPMKSGESLNAAIAASVTLYEIYRQRQLA